jgi:hypothetical protein
MISVWTLESRLGFFNLLKHAKYRLTSKPEAYFSYICVIIVCILVISIIKGCTRLAAASHKVYQLLANGRWLSPGTPASSTTKSGRHDIAEILLKVAVETPQNNH